MHIVRETEKDTQKRVIEFFQDVLNYTYLGNWADSVDENSNIIPEDLADWLRKQNHDPNIINKAAFQLQQAAKIGGSRTLYEANFEVYELLRYGVKVQPDVSEQHKTVWLIDWNNPENNDFGIAEEVALRGKNSKRPDLVLYINGIAIGVLELKRSIVSISEGIRQNLANQTETFIVSGGDLKQVLSDATNRLACSLIHKFGKSGEIEDTDVEIYVIDLKQNLSDAATHCQMGTEDGVVC